MCHNNKLSALPEPGTYQRKETDGLQCWEYNSASGADSKRLIVLPDIYGCNEFYQSFSTYLASKGWQVQLMDLFSDLGELKEVTREAAFERRHLLRDRQICDQLQNFIGSQNSCAVVGFCLGANYALELARRNVDLNLVGYYPFPGGLVNQDQIDTPLDYMAVLSKSVTLLVGDCDDSAGRDNMARVVEVAKTNKALDVHVYHPSGHGFLSHLDSDDKTLRKNAEDSLVVCEQAIAQ
ncbi:MAG: dienelactone hydrolase family protein [Pseudomonadales bacterium]